MKNKLVYVGLGIFLVFVVVAVIMSLSAAKAESNIENKNPDLDKYRSEDIPEECRLPIYEDNLDWWKQHLSHHKETQHCLDYFK